MSTEAEKTPKGAAYVPLAQSFLGQFPLPAPLTKDQLEAGIPVPHIVLTTTELDDFLIAEGVIPNPGSRSPDNPGWYAHLQKRNDWRGRINAGGMSEDMDPGDRFQVQVEQHGESYIVLRAGDGFTRQSDRLPGEIKSLVQTKAKQLRNLHDSVDMTALPVRKQIEIDSLYQEIEDFQERISDDMARLNRKFERTRAWIARHKSVLEVKNGGISQFIGEDDDNEEDRP